MSGENTTYSNSQTDALPPPKPLVTEIQSKFAKMKGLHELETQALFSRDSKRLDAKARAVYEKLGLTLEDRPGDFQMVADNLSLDEQARNDIFKHLDSEMGDVRIVADNITFRGGEKATAPPAQPELPGEPAPTSPGAQSPATDTQNNTLRNLALAAALLTGGAGAGAGLTWLFNPPADTPTFTDSDTDTNITVLGGTPYSPSPPVQP